MEHSYQSPDEQLLFFDRGLEYLRRTEDFAAGLVNIVRSAAAGIGSDSASLYLVKQSTGTLVPYILVNVSPEYLKGCASVPLGTQCCGRAALHKVPWSVADMWNDPLFADCASAARKAGVRAGFSIPVMMPDDTCIGTLAAHYSHIHEPRRSDIDRMTLFARLISMAVLTDLKHSNLNVHDWIAQQLKPGPRAI